jgi:hypothetical protein
MRNIDPFDQVRIKLKELGVKQIDFNNLDIFKKFDIIIIEFDILERRLLLCC